jgi:glycine cleavage system H lipoate-binding protein
MFRARKLKFHHGRMNKDGIHIEMLKDISMFTEYMMALCTESNKTVKTQFINVKVDAYDNWIIKIKTKNKDYFNIIIQRFIKHFGEVITEIEF